VSVVELEKITFYEVAQLLRVFLNYGLAVKIGV